MKQTPRIKISSAAELEKLMDSVANDVVTASIHWKLLTDLSMAATNFEREMNQSLAFWSLTFAAHREAVLFRLARLYDQNDRALSLRTWLGTIEANLDLFDKEGFRERLKDNPFVASLAEAARRPDGKILTADIESVSRKSDALVTKICNLRHKSLAHCDPPFVLGTAQTNTAGITSGDTDHLLGRAETLVNRYSSLFRARTYSTSIVGRDDYESLLKFVRRGLNAHEAAIEREIAGT